MEATINIDDRKTFQSLVHFLRSLNIDVSTKKEKELKERTSLIIPEKDSLSEAVKFWNSINIDMSNFKMNREEAYER